MFTNQLQYNVIDEVILTGYNKIKHIIILRWLWYELVIVFKILVFWLIQHRRASANKYRENSQWMTGSLFRTVFRKTLRSGAIIVFVPVVYK